MRVELHRSFLKDFKKIPKERRECFFERKNLFITDEFHPLLNNHKLNGEFSGHRSINITGDIRAVFYIQNDTAVFVRIGTHPELYRE